MSHLLVSIVIILSNPPFFYSEMELILLRALDKLSPILTQLKLS